MPFTGRRRTFVPTCLGLNGRSTTPIHSTGVGIVGGGRFSHGSVREFK